jgi:hypothetical protein
MVRCHRAIYNDRDSILTSHIEESGSDLQSLFIIRTHRVLEKNQVD